MVQETRQDYVVGSLAGGGPVVADRPGTRGQPLLGDARRRTVTPLGGVAGLPPGARAFRHPHELAGSGARATPTLRLPGPERDRSGGRFLPDCGHRVAARGRLVQPVVSRQRRAVHARLRERARSDAHREVLHPSDPARPRLLSKFGSLALPLSLRRGAAARVCRYEHPAIQPPGALCQRRPAHGHRRGHARSRPASAGNRRRDRRLGVVSHRAGG